MKNKFERIAVVWELSLDEITKLRPYSIDIMTVFHLLQMKFSGSYYNINAWVHENNALLGGDTPLTRMLAGSVKEVLAILE